MRFPTLALCALMSNQGMAQVNVDSIVASAQSVAATAADSGLAVASSAVSSGEKFLQSITE